MKFFLLILLVIFKLGGSIPEIQNNEKSIYGRHSDNILSNSGKDLQSSRKNHFAIVGHDWTKNLDTNFNNSLSPAFSKKTQEVKKNIKNKINKKSEAKLGSVKSTEYILMKTDEGLVSIVDANKYEPVISYKSLDLTDTSLIVVNSTVYNFDTENGTVKSTSLKNLMTNNLTDWKYVGFYPAEFSGKICSPAVNVIEFGTIPITLQGSSASLLMVNNILYTFLYGNFYSFDGTTVTQILNLPDERNVSQLFKLENKVCVVGGNDTNVYPNPVQCYDTVSKNWTIHSYINEARQYLGVAASQSGVHIFGGCSWLNDGHLSETAELLNIKYQKWGYIRSPFRGLNYDPKSCYTQAITFNY